jgi:hypothetical protein
MEFTRLVEIVGDEPVFETGLLLAGDVDPNDVRRQLSRWTQAKEFCDVAARFTQAQAQREPV